MQIEHDNNEENYLMQPYDLFHKKIRLSVLIHMRKEIIIFMTQPKMLIYIVSHYKLMPHAHITVW